MLYEEKFQILIRDPIFKSAIEDFKHKWGLDQKKYQTMVNLLEDEKGFATAHGLKRSVYLQKTERWPYYVRIESGFRKLNDKDRTEFAESLRSLANKFELPTRCADMIYDHIAFGKIKDRYTKVWIEIKFNRFEDVKSEILMHIAPDTRLQDVKSIWPVIAKSQKTMLALNHQDLKNQPLRKRDVIEAIMKPAMRGRKADNIILFDKMVGKKSYMAPNYKELTGRVKARSRSYKSRYLKKLKRHIH